MIRRGNGLGGPGAVWEDSLPPEKAGGADEPWAGPALDGTGALEGGDESAEAEQAVSEDDAEGPVAPRRVVNLRGRGGADAAEAMGDDGMEFAPDGEGPSVDGDSSAGDDAQAEASADEAKEGSPQPRSAEERIRAWRRRAAEARRGAASSMAEEGAPAARSQRRRGSELPEDDGPGAAEAEEAARPWWEL